jgi:hypothetical protein
MSSHLQHQIIARALEIISDADHWTSVVVARAADGTSCSCRDPSAVRFCAIGALFKAAVELVGDDGVAQGFKAEKFVLAANNRRYDTLPSINDAEGHAVIVQMFERALAS